MNLEEKDITTRARYDVCQAHGCTAKPNGHAAKFCARHRKQRLKESQARLKEYNSAQIRKIQGEAEEPPEEDETHKPQPDETGVYRLPDGRGIDRLEIFQNRARFIDQVVARLKAERR